jgi:hypothetical protein
VASNVIAAVPTTVYTATLDQITQPVSRFQITRNGTSFDLYAGSSAGGMKHLANFVSGALNPNRIVFSLSTTGAPASILGLDYIRRLNGVNPTV